MAMFTSASSAPFKGKSNVNVNSEFVCSGGTDMVTSPLHVEQQCLRSFDAVTNERFQMMTAIHFGLKVNWSKVLFGVLEEMVDRTVKKAKGYGAQISVLLNSIPALTMGEATPFPSSKILFPKIVLTYITTNQTADTRGQLYEGGKTPVEIVKRSSKSKKKSESTSDAPVEIVSEVVGSKKRPTVEGSEPVVPNKRESCKRKLILSEGSDDDIVEDIIDVASVNVAGVNIEESIEKVRHVSAEQTFTETDVGDIVFGDSTADNPEELAQWLKNYISEGAEQVNKSDSDRVQRPVDTVDVEQLFETANVEEAEGSKHPVVEKDLVQSVGSKQVAEELMSIDDILLLPRISTLDKGKGILEEDEPVKGNPARETVELICGDVGFLVQLRDMVMKDVVEFFHSFSLNKLPNFDALLELKEKEKMMLEWAETDSLETAVKRKMYILAKYREMLLRKFLDSHRKYFIPGQPWTATASQIIDLLTVAHSKSLEALVAQQKEHGLPIEQPCTSTFLDASVGSGAVLAQFYSLAKSTCWVRPLVLIDGVWTPIQGTDFWRSSCKLSLFVNRKKLPETVIEDTFVPHVLFIEPIQYWGAAPTLIKTWGWHRVCTDIVRYHKFGCLRPVREDVCTNIVIYNLGTERITASFSKNFSQGPGIPTVAQEEQLYFVQSPESPPATSLCLETYTSSTSLSMHFNADDIPLDDTAAIQTSLPVGRTEFVEAINDLRAFILQRIDDSNSEILSKLHTLERGLRDTLHDQDANARKLINSGVTAGADSLEIRKEFKALDAKINSLDGQVVAIRSEQLEFQARIAADHLSLSTQLGDIVDYIRGGDAKNGEGSSRRRPLPTPVHQSEGTGDAVRITDPTQADIDNANRAILERMRNEDRERERKERNRGSRSGSYKRRRF
ncbi:cell division control protein 2C [Dorcoceras hygrometricum]|uniref:Cell division control protein 2C n=1 Tax=Dorcoceras hygrometricum TaxID=472368 RepID=A0A2Z7B4Y0_9LAMI|nr:cell division control protein 2C [Dorcoceras hygrometricum]